MVNPSIRAELDQTPEWWDSQYQELVKKQIPRRVLYHEDHETQEERTLAGTLIFLYCLECGVDIEGYKE